MNEYAKVRVLAVENIIRAKGGATVAEILEALDLRFDIRPKRQTIYQDLREIDRIYPLEYTGQAGGHKWRFINER